MFEVNSRGRAKGGGMPHVIVHFEIPADDVERAKRFYGNLFGWTFQNRKPLPGEGAEYALIETGGRPNGGLMQRMEPGWGVINYFGVEHLDAYATKAQALGGVVLLPKTPLPGVGWWAVLRDTEGNVFAFFQDDPAAA